MTTPDFRPAPKASELRALLDEAEAERDDARECIHRLEGEIETLISEASERDEYVEKLERYAGELKDSLVIAADDLTRYQRREIEMLEAKAEGEGRDV